MNKQENNRPAGADATNTSFQADNTSNNLNPNDIDTSS